ncbi:MAG: hypothetical protein GC190_11690 [Alphaproteobacteria bacterium]|nr:hypothetical protein [Alphaproteobacteria bacterium]
MTDFSEAEALNRVSEVWRWAVKKKRPFFAYLLATAILAFEMDRGPGNFDPPGQAKGTQVDVVKRPRRGRPPKKRR